MPAQVAKIAVRTCWMKIPFLVFIAENLSVFGSILLGWKSPIILMMIAETSRYHSFTVRKKVFLWVKE